ncbi:hypothetical protein AB6A40_009570 [Gnathostoma spinigerum]|uniref:Uncharacterized protein n=1 Tax=Gnathostoma spinigerum TaxID=75299 RepID=A0ABD6EU58_9BILA
MHRREVLLTKPEKELKSVVVGFSQRRARIPSGAMLFLATVADIFPQLKKLSAKSTEYFSNQCIAFCYGIDESDAEYEFIQRRRKTSYCAALIKRAVMQFNSRLQEELHDG